MHLRHRELKNTDSLILQNQRSTSDMHGKVRSLLYRAAQLLSAAPLQVFCRGPGYHQGLPSGNSSYKHLPASMAVTKQ